MKIKLQEIMIREVAAGYINNQEDGVIGYGGKLNIRPKYQREFVYKDKQRNSVIETVRKDFPLNVMYWAVREDGTFEVIDGQQRTISICQYVNGDFAYQNRYFHNLKADEKEQILNYKLMVYVCSGSESEKLEWFKTINIAGEKLTEQELRNAVYTGSWVSDAKRYFSKSSCVAFNIGGDYLNGSPIRQEYLETAISWISEEKIESYMATHQHDPNATALWMYFQSVITWVNATFTNKRKKFMKGIQWGLFYNKYKDVVPSDWIRKQTLTNGERFITPLLKEYEDKILGAEDKCLALEQKIYETAGEKFNLASPKQLGDILFDKLKIGGTKQKKTKTGQYATGEEVLSYLAKDNEIVRDILEWRQMVKLQSTYIDALPNQVDKKTGRVHTDYMQTVAATGRLSSNNPNLQNIPIRTERGRQIRKAFIARDENYTLLSADYSQIELRIIAALSGEENMIKAFQNNEDIHRSTAAKVFNVPLEEVTKEQRSNAKTVNFGIIYGVSAFGLSNQTDLTRSESAALIDAYYKTYPKLKSYMSNQVDFAREHGYVETISGRRRYLKDINSANAVVRGAAERNAVNAPIQGSAADIIKIAMINIHKKLVSENWQSKMLLQVHDELVFDVHNSELEKIKPMIKHEMENAFKMAVPLEVEMGIGRDWLEAH